MDITIKPVITEKATQLTERRGVYTFRVSPEANKYQIKKLVEELYGVKVERVNTMVVRGKTNEWKKAVIKVAGDQNIDFFSNI